MIEIVDYQPKYAGAFRDINLEWIEELFTVEPIDLEVLDHPQEEILDAGGTIVIALREGEPVGAGALKQTAPGCFELTKMGVRSQARGYKAGALLLRALLKKAVERGARELYLLTNRRCAAAVSMYEKFGFVHDPEVMARHGGEYRRCDVAMSYPLVRQTAARTIV